MAMQLLDVHRHVYKTGAGQILKLMRTRPGAEVCHRTHIGLSRVRNADVGSEEFQLALCRCWSRREQRRQTCDGGQAVCNRSALARIKMGSIYK